MKILAALGGDELDLNAEQVRIADLLVEAPACWNDHQVKRAHGEAHQNARVRMRVDENLEIIGGRRLEPAVHLLGVEAGEAEVGRQVLPERSGRRHHALPRACFASLFVCRQMCFMLLLLLFVINHNGCSLTKALDF